MSSPDTDKTLFLLDGYALIYRAYFAFIKNPRINSKGLNTSAMFGFTNLLLDVIQKRKPTHLAVVFDPAEEASERSVIYTEYKAHREEMPEDLRKSLPYIAQIIEAFKIPLLIKEGYEADDVIGTLARLAEPRGFTTYMMTSDKDYGQLVTDKTLWYKPGRMGSPDEVLGIDGVCKKFMVSSPAQVIDLLGLMGDSADNIPGIPGVGEKTAQKLIAEFGSIENLLANTHQLTGKLKEKVEQGAELAIMSKQLATIITDVPVEFDEAALRLEDPDKDKIRSVFAELEFRTMTERVLGETLQAGVKKQSAQMDMFGDFDAAAENSDEAPVIQAFQTLTDVSHQYFVVDDKNWQLELLDLLLTQKEVCFDTETTDIEALNAELVGISFCFKARQAYYIPFSQNREETRETLALFKPFFEHPDIVKIGQNIKYDVAVLANYQITVKGPLFDTMLAHYILQPDLRHGMDFLAETYLHYKPIATTELLGPKGKNQKNMKDLPVDQVAEYCNEDTDITLQLKHTFYPMLQETDSLSILQEIELPLVPVLAAMEREGVNIDVPFLNDYANVLEQLARESEEKVFEQVGERFNLASPKQLGEILFDKLKIDPKAKKTKTGQYATGEEVLVKLRHEHKVVDDILAFRELTKLKSTYVDALPLLINPNTGRVHTSFNQAIAATGRLSSNNPNLQNIPIRTARGKEIRKAFIPRGDGYVLLSADYSQIELRIVAALSGDENMTEAFRTGKDIHTATAAKVFGVSESDVTKEMRYKAKSVNFGIIYGQGAFGLAENLGISRTEAKGLIDSYFKEYAAIRNYMDDQVNLAREQGFVTTIKGRKRYLKDIHSANFTVRGFAERNAINAPIQGSAADIIKIAMIQIHADMEARQMKSKMVLQVHDELVFDVFEPELDTLKALVKQHMEHAVTLPVPLEVEMDTGTNWLEAH